MTTPNHYRLIPRRGNVLTSALGHAVLRLMGWRIEGAFPDLPKFLIIVAPHSSNWDWVIGMSAVLALKVDAHWVAKHTLFRGPLGPLARWLGGVPVDRRASHGFVEATAEAYRQHEQLLIGVTPEGTRKQVSQWKTGFYHIARAAGVPVVPAYFDYPSKVVGIGPPLELGPEQETEVARCRAFFQPYSGRYGRR